MRNEKLQEKGTMSSMDEELDIGPGLGEQTVRARCRWQAKSRWASDD